jgi:hypothetical protein
LKKSYVRDAGLVTQKHAFAAIRLSHISLMKCVKSVLAVSNKAETFINQCKTSIKAQRNNRVPL